MEHSSQHSHTGTCTHCGCNNPLLEIYKDHIIDPGFLTKLIDGIRQVADPEGETLVIYGGLIRTLVNRSTEPVEAIGIHAGEVVATGTLESVRQLMNDKGYPFEEKKLKDNQVLLPGLIEPHVHIVPTAITMAFLDLGRFDGQKLRSPYNPEWVHSTIKESIKHPLWDRVTGKWILGREVDPALMPFTADNELVTIDYKLLDSFGFDEPMLLLSASMHTAYLNTKALKLVYKKFGTNQDFINLGFTSEQVFIDKTQGQLQEIAEMSFGFKSIPDWQIIELFAECLKHLTTIFEEANSRGVTFMYDAAMSKYLKDILDIYYIGHPKKVRTGGALVFSVKDQQANTLGDYAPVTGYKDMYYGHVKLVSDGSNQGLTGYQSEPYCCTPPNNYGVFNFTDGAPLSPPAPPTPPDVYFSLVNYIAQKGWPMMIHANGDCAIQYALDVYKTVIPAGAQTRRNRIEHCSLLTQPQITEMASLGISPSFLIGHVGYWGYAFHEVIFKEKSEMLDLCKSALDAGLKITLHSDFEVSPLGPLRMMEQSITRIMEADPALNVLNPKERLTAEQALFAVTVDAAWQCYAENWVGTLEAGHFADFVILEQDPLCMCEDKEQCTATDGQCTSEIYMKMRDIPVAETWKGGVKVYQGVNVEEAVLQ